MNRWRERRLRLGPKGESVAVRFLRKAGYRILGQNVRSAGGEIDIVAADGDTVVFVEVKTRQSDDTANPEDAVDFPKRRQMVRAAKAFQAETRSANLPARFDVIAIVLRDDEAPEITHFVNAFDARTLR